MMPSRSLLRTILTSRFRDTTYRSLTLTFCAPKRELPPAASPAAWCREPLEAESAASAVEHREQAPVGLRAEPVGREAELPGWFNPRSVPERRWSLSIRPSTEI